MKWKNVNHQYGPGSIALSVGPCIVATVTASLRGGGHYDLVVNGRKKTFGEKDGVDGLTRAKAEGERIVGVLVNRTREAIAEYDAELADAPQPSAPGKK